MIIARGTYTSSFIAYLIGISNVNPIKYNLYPEFAFGNKGDKKLDIDFAYPAKLQPKFEEMNTYNIQRAHPSKYLDFVYRCLTYDPDITFEEWIFSNEKYVNYFAPYYLGISDLVHFFPLKTQDDLVKIALLKSAHGMLEAMHNEVGPDLELIDINQLILSREDLYDLCLNAGFTEDEGYTYVHRKFHSKDDLTEFENGLASSDWTLNQDKIFQQQLKYAFSSRYMFPKGHWISLTQACIKNTSLIFENCIGME